MTVKQLHSLLIHKYVTCITAQLFEKQESNGGRESLTFSTRSMFI